MTSLGPADVRQGEGLKQWKELGVALFTAERELEGLTEQGRRLEEEKRELLRIKQGEIDENSRLVECGRVRVEKLEEERTAFLMELEARKEVKNGKLKASFLPPELIAEVAEYCSAKDQVSLKLLCKCVKAVLPKLILLNFKHLKESLVIFNRKPGYKLPSQWPFQLNPLVVEKEPFSVLEIIDDTKRLGGSERLRLVSSSLGACLEMAMIKVLQHPDHPKFSLLTLPLASYANSVPAMEFLLMPVNRQKILDKHYENAIYSACLMGCAEALKILLDLHSPLADPSIEQNWPIRLAARWGNARCVELLLRDPRVNPADRRNQAIQEAAENGHIEAFLLLHQDERVDPSTCENECIRVAAVNGHLAIFNILLQDGRVNPASNDNYCIRYATKNGHISIVHLLLADPRVDASAGKNYALRCASYNGHISIVRLLLGDPRVRVDASACDKNGDNALQLAASRGHPSIVRLLLGDSRVDVLANGNEALKEARMYGHL